MNFNNKCLFFNSEINSVSTVFVSDTPNKLINLKHLQRFPEALNFLPI